MVAERRFIGYLGRAAERVAAGTNVLPPEPLRRRELLRLASSVGCVVGPRHARRSLFGLLADRGPPVDQISTI